MNQKHLRISGGVWHIPPSRAFLFAWALNGNCGVSWCSEHRVLFPSLPYPTIATGIQNPLSCADATRNICI